MLDTLQSKDQMQRHYALSVFKNSCESHRINAKEKQNIKQSNGQGNRFLQKLFMRIRVMNLKNILTKNFFVNNFHSKRCDFQVLSKKEVDQLRMIKIEGIRIDYKILAIIYIVQIIFIAIMFLSSSLAAFIEDFRNQQNQREPTLIVLKIIALILTFSKIILSAITKKTKNGRPLIYITDIFESQLKSFAIYIDLFYTILLLVFLGQASASFSFGFILFIMCVIKLLSSFQNFVVFQTTFIRGFKNQQYWNLFKTILFNVFFANFIASMLLAMSKIDPDDNWMVKKQINNEPWTVQYMWAYYFATTIMMTIGFGDISATNHNEAMTLAFIQTFSCIVLAYNITAIGSIISAIRTSHNQYQKKVSIFKRMAQEDEINMDLKIKIQGFFKEQKQIKQSLQIHLQSQLLTSIPQTLRNQYVLQSNKKFFRSIPFFRNIQKSSLRKFNQFFTSQAYYPGQFILSLRKVSQSIMILKQGKVGLTYKKSGSTLNGITVQSVQITKGQVHTGNGSFQKKNIPIILNADFFNFSKKINYQIVAEAYSFVQMISYDDFLSTLKQSQFDSSYYFSILHRTLISKNQWIQIECEKCSLQNKIEQEISVIDNEKQKNTSDQMIEDQKQIQYHTKFDCPKLHFVPSKNIVVLKHIKSKGKTQQGKATFFRKKKRQEHCYVHQKRILRKFEQDMNISARKKRQIFFEKSIIMSPSIFKKIRGDNLLKQEIEGKKQKKISQQIIQNIVLKVITQTINLPNQQHWPLEIDQMKNYLNYFPKENARNFNNLSLSRRMNQFYFANKLDIKYSQQLALNNKIKIRPISSNLSGNQHKQEELQSAKKNKDLSLKYYQKRKQGGRNPSKINIEQNKFIQLSNTEENEEKPFRYESRKHIISDQHEEIMNRTGNLLIYDISSKDEQEIVIESDKDERLSQDSISSQNSTSRQIKQKLMKNDSLLKTEKIMGDELKKQKPSKKKKHKQ